MQNRIRRSRLILGLFVLTGLIAWGGALGFSEDEKPKPMSEQEMWQRAAQLAQPGEMHKTMGVMCGTWKIAGKAFTGMGEMPFTGESKSRWVLGGRFIEITYEGPGMMGEKMEGRGLLGYDNGKKEFQQAWAMTMGTTLGYTTGAYDAEKKSFTFSGTVLGPDGVTYRKRQVMVFDGDDKYVETHYAAPDEKGAKEVKEVEMTGTRVKP